MTIGKSSASGSDAARRVARRPAARTRSPNAKELPGPDASRTVQTLHWLRRPYPYMRECSQRFGDLYLLRLHALGDVVILANPSDIEEVFRMPGAIAATGEANMFMAPLLGTESLFVLDGEAHLTRRRLLNPLTSPNHGERCAEALCDIVQQELPPAGVMRTTELMRWIALRLVALRVLGTSETADLRGFTEQLRWLTGTAGAIAAFLPALQRDLGPMTPGFWFRKQLARTDAALFETLRAASRRPASRTSAASEIRAARGTPSDMADQSLRDDVITLLTAGDDTTASAMSWTLFWIARSPEVQERLLHGDDGIPAGADAKAILASPFLERVCLEALRISPVVEIVSRKTRAPLELGGYTIPAGVLLSPSIYLAHQRSDVFADPGEFRPDRFEARYRPSEFFPFGGGTRRCIGAGLALVEIRIVVGTILSRFRLKPARRRDAEYKPKRRNVTVAPADPLLLVLEAR